MKMACTTRQEVNTKRRVVGSKQNPKITNRAQDSSNVCGKNHNDKKKRKEKKETLPYMCRKRFVLEQKLVPLRSAAAFRVQRDAGSPLLVSLLLSHCQQRTGGDG